ncbi:MAG TPA: trypsin-like serine protease [Bacteriovoracaceae bacterium]|nr:trypsin-like serine protease [Bacteriovoracaceae bacterium]
MNFLIGMVFLMTIEAFTKVEQWTQYNSSLLIEVTRPNGVFTCTGVAVSPTIVVTAAHCLEGEIKGVRVFTQQSYDPGQGSLVMKNYKIHPDYKPKASKHKADIAKIVMKDKLPSFIRLLPIYEGFMVTGNILRFGFGAREGKNIRTVVTPRFRKMNLQEQVLELDDKFSRSGDSGGPIFMENGQDIKLVAIHSTFSHGPEGEFSLNPRLAAYLSWIYEN